MPYLGYRNRGLTGAVPAMNTRKRVELMTSGGTEGSATVLPVMLAGQPFDQVSEVDGVLLEQEDL